MIEFLNNLDTSVFLAINGAHSPFFDSFMTMFTGRFIWIPMYAMVLWILFRNRPWQVAASYLVMLVAAIALTDQFCSSVIRPAVERLRPSNLQNTLSEFAYVVNDYRGGSYGFPSCHAANSFALATFMALFAKRRSFTFLIFGWAAVNSYSRLYLGVHYPGDLLVGGIIGASFGFLCYLGATRLESLLASSRSRTPASSASSASSASVESPSPRGASNNPISPRGASGNPGMSDSRGISGNRSTPDTPSFGEPAWDGAASSSLSGVTLMMATFALTLLFIIISSLIALA